MGNQFPSQEPDFSIILSTSKRHLNLFKTEPTYQKEGWEWRAQRYHLSVWWQKFSQSWRIWKSNVPSFGHWDWLSSFTEDNLKKNKMGKLNSIMECRREKRFEETDKRMVKSGLNWDDPLLYWAKSREKTVRKNLFFQVQTLGTVTIIPSKRRWLRAIYKYKELGFIGYKVAEGRKSKPVGGREPMDRNSTQKVSPSRPRFIRRILRSQDTGFPNQLMGTQEGVRNCLACKHGFLIGEKLKLIRQFQEKGMYPSQ